MEHTGKEGIGKMDLRGVRPWCPILVVLAAGVSAGPTVVELEEFLQESSWIVTADLAAAPGVMSAVVKESFRGEYVPGDTIRFEMDGFRRITMESLPGVLLIADGEGFPFIVGVPGRGYWTLETLDFPVSVGVTPRVISSSELIGLLKDGFLPPREVKITIWTAGGGEIIEMVAGRTERHWVTESGEEYLDGLVLEGWMLDMGESARPGEPPVRLDLTTRAGKRLRMSGRIMEADGNVYSCRLFPTSPLIGNLRGLVEYIMGSIPPSPLSIGISIEGARPGELGMGESPRFVVNSKGDLVLETGYDELYMCGVYPCDGGGPLYAFTGPGEDSVIFFGFEGLPNGPSGHLATDLLDVLEKGCVTGMLREAPGDEPVARFTLFLIR